MKNKKYEKIINIASLSAVRSLEIGPEYSSSKAGLVILIESLAKKLANTGVTANCVSPGVVLTDLVETIFSEKYSLHNAPNDYKLHELILKKFFQNLIGKIPLPNDIANTVLFLSSHDSDKITGQNIVIDSGYLLSNDVSDSVE
jgi:NAD(P)-dependent dehydrogenase (short-subunit alcohol dehydrogenase family)